jgi:protein-S-isoprenylcysteine O-methyltransferase Ste14
LSSPASRSLAKFALESHGMPAPPFPTDRQIVSGLYRRVRNPMYLAVLALIVGQALLLGDGRLLIYAAVVGLAVHAFVVAHEEPTLGRRYGDQYGAFRARGVWLARVAPADLGGQPPP